jgi:sialic acid synthase SpsE
MTGAQTGVFERVFIIAEAGVNHNGDLDTALRLIEAAKNAGADAVKFQEFTLEGLFAPAAYERVLGLTDASWRGELRRITFKPQWRERVWEHASRIGIACFSTPFHPQAVRALAPLVPFYKVASGDITNTPLLESIAETGKGVFLSTGASTLDEIDDAVSLLLKASPPFICPMHCIMLYPPPDETLNLSFIDTLRERYDLPVGFSDHTRDDLASILAAGRGAAALEKHLTLDRNQKGADHAGSLDPDGFRSYVGSVRRTEIALGGRDRVISEAEKEERVYARRGIYASREIGRGELIASSHLVCLRPNTGIGAESIREVLGRRARVDIPEGVPLDFSMLE